MARTKFDISSDWTFTFYVPEAVLDVSVTSDNSIKDIVEDLISITSADSEVVRTVRKENPALMKRVKALATKIKKNQAALGKALLPVLRQLYEVGEDTELELYED